MDKGRRALLVVPRGREQGMSQWALGVPHLAAHHAKHWKLI